MSPDRMPDSQARQSCYRLSAQLLVGLLACLFAVLATTSANAQGTLEKSAATIQSQLRWERLPDLPDSLGVAGPFVGVHQGVLLVAGGANFPRPVWENEKVWRRQIHVLIASEKGYRWRDGGKLPQAVAYGASVTTPDGVICLGGNNATETFDSVFSLRWDPRAKRVTQIVYPRLPKPCAYGQAALIGQVLYVCGGQLSAGIESAMDQLWALDLSGDSPLAGRRWKQLPPCPGGPRAFNLTVAQATHSDACLFVISGRRRQQGHIHFLRDVWEFNVRLGKWRQRANVPQCVMAGTAIAWRKQTLLVLGGADGTLFGRADELKDRHPGFPKQSYEFHTSSNTWSTAGVTPQNHVTTTAVMHDGHIVIPSGEIRPRVRSPWVWKISSSKNSPGERPKSHPN